MYFENVGGAVWDAVVPLLNTHARIPLCGLIAQYNATSLPPGPDRSSQLMGMFLVKQIKVQGFIISNYFNRQAAFIAENQSGVDILTTIENVVGSRAGDTIKGNRLANILDGDTGNDCLTGGGRADVFVFSRGNDQITDFDAGRPTGRTASTCAVSASARRPSTRRSRSGISGANTKVIVEEVGNALLVGVSGSAAM